MPPESPGSCPPPPFFCIKECLYHPFPGITLLSCLLHWQVDSQPLRHQGSPPAPFQCSIISLPKGEAGAFLFTQVFSN